MPEDNVNFDSYVIPADGAPVTLGEREYRWCNHCRTPKPAPQIDTEGKNAGICISCINGRNNYDRLAKHGLIPYRAGFEPPAPAEKPVKAKGKSKTTTNEEGQEVAPDGTALGVDVTTGEPIGANA